MADSDLWDVVQWHEGRTKRYTQKIGYAKESKDGGFYITLTALPIPVMDEKRGLTLQIQVQRPYKKDARPNSGGYGRGRDRDNRNDMDDEIPF